MRQKFEAAEGEEWREFYEQHQGGVNVIMCIVSEGDKPYPSRFALFSCIEKAEEWASQKVSDDCQVCFAPFIIDEPDFGNAVKN